MNTILTKNIHLFFLLFVCLFAFSCGKGNAPKNHITPEDDVAIGAALDEEILHYISSSNSISYLNNTDYSSSYQYLNTLRDNILETYNFNALVGLPNASISNIKFRIIDKTGNTGAFVVPGGYIYLYKDFLQKINCEAQIIPILSHLLACSKGRYAQQKLENRFSPSFLLDLILGADYSSTGVDISSVISELEDVPYDSTLVKELDIEAESTTCELGYDIKTYSDLFTNPTSQNLKWYQQFPRESGYPTYLFNVVKDRPACINGEMDEGDYPAFKTSLN